MSKKLSFIELHTTPSTIDQIRSRRVMNDNKELTLDEIIRSYFLSEDVNPNTGEAWGMDTFVDVDEARAALTQLINRARADEAERVLPYLLRPNMYDPKRLHQEQLARIGELTGKD